MCVSMYVYVSVSVCLCVYARVFLLGAPIIISTYNNQHVVHVCLCVCFAKGT